MAEAWGHGIPEYSAEYLSELETEVRSNRLLRAQQIDIHCRPPSAIPVEKANSGRGGAALGCETRSRRQHTEPAHRTDSQYHQHFDPS